MSDWDDAVDEVNAAVNSIWASPFTYVAVTTDGAEYPVEGVLDEHAIEEPISPGRYIRFIMPIDELPFPPRSGDQIQVDTDSYDITEVVADQYQSYVLMLRKVGE